MRRILLAAAAFAVLPLLGPRIAHAQSDEQTLVDRATLAVQEMATGAMSEDPRTMLQRSRGAMICPRERCNIVRGSSDIAPVAISCTARVARSTRVCSSL